MIKARKLTDFEKIFITSNERCQFALKVSKPSLIPKLIRNLEQYILGFHLKLDGINLVYHNDPIEVHSIPKSVKSVKDACNFMDSVNYDYRDKFAIIGANDDTVAISVSHLICDGGFFVNIYDKLLLDEPIKMKSIFPITTNETFPEELSKVESKDIVEHQNWFKKLTALKYSDNYLELQKKFGDNVKCKYYPVEIPVKDTQFYKAKGLKLTDLYMTSFALSIMSLNGQLHSNFGISNCIDLRQYLPPSKREISNTQNTAEFGVLANNVDFKMSIRDLAKMFRSDLAMKMNDGKTPLTSYKSLHDVGLAYDVEKTCFPELSNIGRFRVDDTFSSLINDMWIQQTMNTKFAEIIIGIVAFSKDKFGENTIVTRLQQPVTVVNDRDADVLMKSFVHMMKEVPVDVSIQEAYDELRRFQTKILQK